MGLGTINIKHQAYVYIKPIANGVVVECGNQIVGDEAVFYSSGDYSTRKIINTYLDVIFNIHDAKYSTKEEMLKILNAHPMETLNK